MPPTDYQAFKLRLVAYTLDENLPSIPDPTSTEPHYYTPEPPATLSTLDCFPFEIFQITLPLLDLQTLMAFRRVNQRCLQLVDTLPEYKAINTHASNALQGTLSIELGSWITCNELFATLCTTECKGCGDFGGYIFLLTCTRICFLCFRRKRRYMPLEVPHAKELFNLSPERMAQLPQMRSLAGVYTPLKKKPRERITLVDYGSVQAAGRDQEVIEGKRQSYRQELFWVHLGRNSRNPRRFMAIVRVPWFNRACNDVE